MMNYLAPADMDRTAAFNHYVNALYMDIPMEVLAAAKRRMDLIYKLTDDNCDLDKLAKVYENSPIYQYWYWRFDCDEKVTA